MGVKRSAGLLLALGLSLACSGETATIPECIADGGITPICGFQNPEDLAPLPGGSWIAVSQGGEPGSLIAYRVSDGRKLELFPREDDLEPAAASRGPIWGAPDCQGSPDPATFSPHGIDTDIHAHRLALVNHGARGSVELFELGRSPRGLLVRGKWRPSCRPSLWMRCARAGVARRG